MSRPLRRTVPLKSRTSYLICVHLCAWWSGSALDFSVLIVWVPKRPPAGLSWEKVMVSSKCFCQWVFCILPLAFLPNACYPTHSNCTFQTEQNLLDFLQQTMRKAFLDWLRTFLPWFPYLHAANAFQSACHLMHFCFNEKINFCQYFTASLCVALGFKPSASQWGQK